MTAPGRSPLPLAQPSVTPAASGATVPMTTGAVENGADKVDRVDVEGDHER